MERLVLLACTATKRPDAGEIPALLRYNGPSVRVLRAYLRAHPAEIDRLDILFLSACYGLIAAHTPIADYDQRMTKPDATAFQPLVSAALTRAVSRRGPYAATLIHLGPVYGLALASALDRLPDLGTITRTSGGIGVRLAQIKAWLNNY